jgi:peroxiredoxin Q/BCP
MADFADNSGNSNYEACSILRSARVMSAPLYAALAPGAKAPDFTTQATLAGKPFTFSLAEALKQGPGGAVFLSGGLHARMHGRGA